MTEELSFEERENRLTDLQFQNSQIYSNLLELVKEEDKEKFKDLLEEYVNNEIEQEELCD